MNPPLSCAVIVLTLRALFEALFYLCEGMVVMAFGENKHQSIWGSRVSVSIVPVLELWPYALWRSDLFRSRTMHNDSRFILCGLMPICPTQFPKSGRKQIE
jgi:hypothetical protein